MLWKVAQVSLEGHLTSSLSYQTVGCWFPTAESLSRAWELPCADRSCLPKVRPVHGSPHLITLCLNWYGDTKASCLSPKWGTILKAHLSSRSPSRICWDLCCCCIAGQVFFSAEPHFPHPWTHLIPRARPLSPINLLHTSLHWRVWFPREANL